MAGVPNRYSTHSNFTTRTAQGAIQGSNQVSTQTLLTSLHTAYASGKPYILDASTSVVVNTWVNAASDAGPAVDVELAHRVWEHARRRAEDGCVVLTSPHDSSPSLFSPFISQLPLNLPSSFYSALTALRPFLECATPKNPNTSRASAIAATFGLTSTGSLTNASIRLSTSGIDTQRGLLNVPSEHGFRAFDAFYYLLSSASTPAEREALGLRSPSNYALLRRSETYSPPSYLPTADDAASAEDFRAALRAIGINSSSRRDILSTLAALLKLGETTGFLLDEDELDAACEDAASLLGMDIDVLVQKCNSTDREILVGGIYEALVDWVLSKANETIATELALSKGHSTGNDGTLTPNTSEDETEVSITVLEVPSEKLGKAVSLKTSFDDSEGINAEMKLDEVTVAAAGHSVVMEMKTAIASCEPEMGMMTGHLGREREVQYDRRENVLDKVGHEVDEDSFLRTILYQIPEQGISLGRAGRFDMPLTIGSSRTWSHISIHPTDTLPGELSPNISAWSAGSVSAQLRSWRLPEWANRRNKQFDFTADFDFDEFCTRYRRLGCKDGRDGIESFILERGWSNGEAAIGKERIWIREGAWWQAETMLEMLPNETVRTGSLAGSHYQQGRSPFGDYGSVMDDRDTLLQRGQSTNTYGGRSLAPTQAKTSRNVSGGDYGLGMKGDDTKGAMLYENEIDPELADPKAIVQTPTSKGRRLWVAIVWALTFWIPSFSMRFFGRMKRPDVRMAWREKLVLVFGIAFLNAFIIFYIIVFGRLLCPNFDKAWDPKELSYHQGTNDFYVSAYGKVYDISKFWKTSHSNIQAQPVTDADMLPLAGLDVTQIFPKPLSIACAGLVELDTLTLETNITDPKNQDLLNTFKHTAGQLSPFPDSDLKNPHWYNVTFLPRMKDYYKGDLVREKSLIESAGENDDHYWFTVGSKVYDLSDYFYTTERYTGNELYAFFDKDFSDHVQQYAGQDMEQYFQNWEKRDSSAAAATRNCLENNFYVGKTDFRQSAKCQANNYILLAFTIILCAVILTKFLAALQLGSKKKPSAQDKFVICQVPAYTEGEDHLRKGLDSLTALAYDNKRKLICVICDGMIVGGGNDRPTPKIVLDILGVDPKIDPPALPFKSVGASSEQLNYGKVYSGLYEYEGNVVPYLVVVKVGKESEQTKAKPGNRGKRDSQILLMSFLNRVHHRAPMSPLELEMFHQINNIIGVDPELYEYMFMVDADTMVKEDALNRLVAACANDAKIAGICGETSLENEERSWWTMIQVYEYFISHNLAKSFESLFGSVTCLPGCFCMYRLRTADKGKPLIISDKVINEYADCEVDTLHKKNLLALGEDRYLTTLMTKHFPFMSYKFVPGALALTAAPDTWSILLSQRRRWINSTIHNLAELIFIKDLCGFCCFSMRFVIFIDLFGTLILPATCIYLVYLIYRVASHTGQFPLISIIMIGAVYGLQAIIFLVKRQWQHIGWMIIYILAYPVYSFILPIYSFWKQDDFSWGNTRIVLEEKGSQKVMALEDEGFDPRSIPLQRWDDYATSNNLPGRRGMAAGASSEKAYGYDDAYEMEDMRSVYSGSIKPASTVLTGFRSQMPGGVYMPPQSPAPFQQRPDMQQRHSTYSDFTRYTDNPMQQQMQPQHGSMMSLGQMSAAAFQQQQMYQQQMQQQQMMQGMSPGQSPYHGAQSPYNMNVSPYNNQSGARSPMPHHSTDNLMGTPSPPMNRAGRSSPMPSLGGGGVMTPGAHSRVGSTLNLNPPDFQNHPTGQGEPSDATITETIRQVLGVVDLDTVTKKMVRGLVEQRLGVGLGPQKREYLDRGIDVELAEM